MPSMDTYQALCASRSITLSPEPAILAGAKALTANCGWRQTGQHLCCVREQRSGQALSRQQRRDLRAREGRPSDRDAQRAPIGIAATRRLEGAGQGPLAVDFEAAGPAGEMIMR